MFKQVVLPLLAVIIFIVVVGLIVKKSPSFGLAGRITPTPTALSEKTVNVESNKINVQIADTAEKRSKGLSGVTSLKSGNGMLFVFDTKNVTPVFWMKDMLIPLDIIWIGNAKIVHIDKNVPIPAQGTPDSGLKTYSAGQPIDYVLEVNAGFSDANGIKIGSAIDLSGI